MNTMKVYLGTSVTGMFSASFAERGGVIMAAVIKEPEISERFDLDDIRKIREYNAAGYEE